MAIDKSLEDDGRNDTWTRQDLLRARDYPAEVVNGNGHRSSVAILEVVGAEAETLEPVAILEPAEPVAICSQCGAPAIGRRATCGAEACIAGHDRSVKAASYHRLKARQKAPRASTPAKRKTPTSEPVSRLSEPSGVAVAAVLHLAQVLAETVPEGWTATIADGRCHLCWEMPTSA